MARINGVDDQDVNELAERILTDVFQSLAEYSFVHTPEQLQQLVSDPETDPIFLQEVKDDILEILGK
ncbi:MAG: hypothetical protein JNM06_17695 [Blastocatellia bacterium]|nr:hypothetical protein [Blastocatellia bacterium]MBN8721513.1 hypothetical protein [Acidobacteriota bacterium]